MACIEKKLTPKFYVITHNTFRGTLHLSHCCSLYYVVQILSLKYI